MSKSSCAKFVKIEAALDKKACDKSQHSKKEMISLVRYLVLLAVVMMCTFAAQASSQNTRMVIYDGVATEVGVAPNASSDLWITTSDLTRATRFVIKPQGVCRDELCFPLPKSRKAEFVARKGATTWFN